MSVRSRMPAPASPISLRLARGLAVALVAAFLAAGAAACTSGGNPTNSQLASLRSCESGGNYRINTGNGYYGAYQFDLQTWRRLGFGGYPHQAAPATQDAAVRKLYAQRGWGPWPVCGQRARGA